MRKINVKKDSFFNDLFSSKWFLLLMAVFLFLYLKTGSKVLNFPKYFVWVSFIISALAIIILFSVRYKKHKQYYKRKLQDKLYLFFYLICILFFTFLIHFFLRIPANLIVEKAATNSDVEYYNCEIKSVTTVGYDKISFIFLKNKYSRFYSIAGYNSQELKSDYMIKLEVKKSILDAYYVTKFELVKKQ